MQRVFLISNQASLKKLNNFLESDDHEIEWEVLQISEPNAKGEWLVVVAEETEDIDVGGYEDFEVEDFGEEDDGDLQERLQQMLRLKGKRNGDGD